MKKRNKKRDTSKLKKALFNRQAPDIIDNSAIYQLPGGKCEFLSLNNKHMSIDALRRVYCDMPHRWTVALLVFKVSKSGSKTFEVQHVSPPVECKNDAIAESVEAVHNKMIGKCDKKEFVAGGWLAIPRDEIISNNKLMGIFDGLGVWDDYITNNGYVLFEERNQLTDNNKG